MNIVIAIIFISVIGTLLHFMYEWSGHNKVVSLFAAVNESTWEHIKIALTPTYGHYMMEQYMALIPITLKPKP